MIYLATLICGMLSAAQANRVWENLFEVERKLKPIIIGEERPGDLIKRGTRPCEVIWAKLNGTSGDLGPPADRVLTVASDAEDLTRKFLLPAECYLIVAAASADDAASLRTALTFADDVLSNKKLLVLMTSSGNGSLPQLDPDITFKKQFMTMVIDVETLDTMFYCPVLGEREPILTRIACPGATRDPRGKSLNISAAGLAPFISRKFVGNRTMVVGSDVDVINLFARKMGFTYSIRRERHAGWYRGPNGTNDGMVYRVANRDADVGIGQLTYTLERLSYLDFLPHVSHRTLHFVVLRPKPVDSIDTLFVPWDSWVWLATGISIVVTALALLVIEVALRKWRRKDDREFRAFALPLATVLSGSVPDTWILKNPLHSKRALLFLWLPLSLLISLSYRSVLLAVLATTRYEKPIDTLADLLDAGIPLLVPYPSIIYKVAKVDPRPSMREVIRKSIPFEYGNGTKPWVIEMWQRGEAATTMDSHSLKKWTHMVRPGREQILSGVYYTTYLIQRMSPLENHFKLPIIWLRDTGVIEKMTTDNMRGLEAPKDPVFGNQPLSVGQLSPAFIALLIGIAIGGVSFALETLLASRRLKGARGIRIWKVIRRYSKERREDPIACM